VVLHLITARFCLRPYHFVIWLSFSNIWLRDFEKTTITAMYHGRWFAYKCADPELERQIRCFPYGERFDVSRLQQVEQKAVGRQRNLGLMVWCSFRTSDIFLEFDDSGQLSTKIYFSAETEYISTRYWYRNINFLRDRIRRIFL
jgi:hypothetical protein